MHKSPFSPVSANSTQMQPLANRDVFHPVSTSLVPLQLDPGDIVRCSVLIHKPLQEQGQTQLLLMSGGIAAEYNAGIIKCWRPYQNSKVRWKILPVNTSVDSLSAVVTSKHCSTNPQGIWQSCSPLYAPGQNDEGLSIGSIFALCSSSGEAHILFLLQLKCLFLSISLHEQFHL